MSSRFIGAGVIPQSFGVIAQDRIRTHGHIHIDTQTMEEAMLARQRTTAPVSMRALIARINRRLRDDGEVLKAARSERVASSIGLFFIVRGNRIASEQVDPEALARKLGVLSAWEHLE